MRRSVTLWFCICFVVWGRAQQPFVCDGSVYITIDQELFRLQVDRGNEDFELLPIAQPTGLDLNALGYRLKDNFIYGIADHLSYYTLCRIDADGEVATLDTLDIPQGLTLPAGTITADSRYLIVLDAPPDFRPAQFNRILLIDLESPDYDLSTITVQPNQGDRNNVFSADLAFDPVDGLLYGFDYYEKSLFSYEIGEEWLDFNGFQQVSFVDGAIPSLFFDAFGHLQGHERNSNFNQLYFINKDIGAVQFFENTEGIRPAPYRDGCSCPYTVTMEKRVFPEVTYPCTEVEYRLLISNLSQKPQQGLTLKDLLPEGFILKEILHNPFQGEVSGIETGELTLDHFELPYGVDTLRFRVWVPELTEGIYYNQAKLSGLDLSLGNDPRTEILSDFVLTKEKEDPTPLKVLSLNAGIFSEIFELCPDSALTLQPAVVQSGVLQIHWDDGTAGAVRTVEEPGTYTVTVASGCEQQTTVFNVIPSAMALSLGQDLNLEFGDSVRLQPHIETSFPITDYSWSIEGISDISCVDCPRPVVRPQGAVRVHLEVFTAFGCKAQDEMTIALSRHIYIPTAFSPNGDGVNEFFFVQARGAAVVRTFRIFDRWGALLFDGNELPVNVAEMGWDGTTAGKALPAGVYVWTAEMAYPDGLVSYRHGEVILMR